MNQTYDWIPFYEEFANKLLEYKDNRAELFSIIKDLVSQNSLLTYLHFEHEDWWSVRNYEIDPFSVFGIFNRNLTVQNRIELISLLAKTFNLHAAIPTDFSGIPIMDPRRAFFVGNDEVWALFEEALSCANNGEFTEKIEQCFENAINVNGNGLGTITMGLFWIRPNVFLSLDRQNKEFLSDDTNGLNDVVAHLPKDIKKCIPNGHEYVVILQELTKFLNSGDFEFDTISKMSHCAWINKSENESNEKPANISKASFLKWFTPLIQALKDLGGSATPKEAIAKIAENEKLSEDVLNETRGKSEMKKFDNEVNWARNYLVYARIIDNSVRGVWTLTQQGYNVIITDEIATLIFQKKWSIEPYCINFENLDDIANNYLLNPLEDESASIWLPRFYSPEISKEEWLKLLDDKRIFTTQTLEIMKQFKDCNGQSTCNHLVKTYGENTNFYKYNLQELAIRVLLKTKCNVLIEDEHHFSLIPILFQYRQTLENNNIFYLLKIRNELYSALEEFDLSEISLYAKDKVSKPYTKSDFLNEVFIKEEKDYTTLTSLLHRKKNIILQGAPGVGKTFAAKRLAYSIMGEKDDSRVETIQFHQSYSYEDFIMGYRPDGEGFKLEHGVFYKFCKKAKDDQSRQYFFIIDEINRGNLSKIFGELFMLVEHDKRGEENSIRLLYANEPFYIPENVHIIGMMNTADRSLAMLDYALRRRFAFYEMKPAFDSNGFTQYQESIDNKKFNKLIEVVKSLNDAIKKDESLGAGFRIGHSYFIENEIENINDTWLYNVVNYELIPLLQEYWFDEKDNVEHWTDELKGALK